MRRQTVHNGTTGQSECNTDSHRCPLHRTPRMIMLQWSRHKRCSVMGHLENQRNDRGHMKGESLQVANIQVRDTYGLGFARTKHMLLPTPKKSARAIKKARMPHPTLMRVGLHLDADPWWSWQRVPAVLAPSLMACNRGCGRDSPRHAVFPLHLKCLGARMSAKWYMNHLSDCGTFSPEYPMYSMAVTLHFKHICPRMGL